MDPFKGKSAAERNKLIAAVVLGVLAVAALAFAFGPGLFSRGTSASVSVSTATPRPQNRPNENPQQFQMPSASDQEFDYATTPILYSPGSFGAPDPGRNIFAFYEPPPPTPYSPTPFPTPKPATPTPTPPILVHQISPPSVYAGSRGFRLDIMGERMSPDARIYLNQSEVPTRFVNEQRLSADIPANFIANAGSAQVIVQTPDGRSYSNAVMLSVMPPPRPQVAYVGMISRAHGNNDTAYFIDQNSLNRPGVVPTGARLNDVVGGRFRVVSIASNRVVLEDTQLGFKHPLEIYKPPPGAPVIGSGSGFPGMPVNRGFPSGFPNVPVVPRPNTNTNRVRPMNPNEKRDDDDDDDDGDG